MSAIVDDKSDPCVSFILDYMSKKSSVDAQQSPIFIGVNGARTSNFIPCREQAMLTPILA